MTSIVYATAFKNNTKQKKAIDSKANKTEARQIESDSVV